MTQKTLQVLIMAGGTGGHVFPALAVADELRTRGAQINWLGTARGIETRLVPAANIPLHFISVEGVLRFMRVDIIQLHKRKDIFINDFLNAKEIEALPYLYQQSPIVSVVKGNKAERRNIKLGRENPSYYEVLEGLKEGRKVKKGEAFCDFGKAEENGFWPAHLHFQLMCDMEGKKGDYPGVCSKKELDFYLDNCPNPNLLLSI